MTPWLQHLVYGLGDGSGFESR